MTQPSLFAPGAVDPAPVVGAKHGQVFTPQSLADLCLERVVHTMAPPARGHRVIEPSIGGGAFGRSVKARLPKATLYGIDIDPLARGLELADVAEVAETVAWCATAAKDPALVIGNPDFAAALEHVLALLALRPYRMALILPSDRQGRHGWMDALYGQPEPGIRLREVHPIFPRPWPDLVREVSLFVWGWEQPGGQRIIGDPIVWRKK